MTEAEPHAERISHLATGGAKYPRADVSWPASRLAELEASVRADDAFQSNVARVLLLASQHAFSEAAEIFAVLVRTQASRLFQPSVFSHLLMAALSLQRTDLLAMMLCAHPAAPARNEFRFSTSMPHPMRIEIAIDDQGACVWTICMSLAGGDVAPRFVTSLLTITDLVGRYTRAADSIAGRVNVSLGDIAAGDGLGFSASDPGVFLIPDSHFIASRGYAALRDSYRSRDVPWSDRSPVAFWRGSLTGIRKPPEKSWRSLQRIQLCRMSLDHPAKIDAGISGIGRALPLSEACEITAAGLMREPVPPDQFLRYRYQIDVDGNSNAWQGLFMKLLSGSVVLKAASPYGFRQWYYDRLHPWVNYVPVAADLSDLLPAIATVRSDDAFAQTIGDAGRALALSLDYEREMNAALATIGRAIVAGTANGTVANRLSG